MWVIIRITVFTHKHSDELTASKWVRGHPFVTNILRAASHLSPSRRDEHVTPPAHIHTAMS